MGKSKFYETCIGKVADCCISNVEDEEKSIGKYSSMIEEHFDMLCYEFRAWVPDYDNEELNLV